MMKRERVIVLATVLCGLVATAELGMADVGVNDPCPWPTPYPPAGAGWAATYNPDFETGFTDGVADQWTGWKDSFLPGTVFYDGTDRVYTGSHSQKLAMPTPTMEGQEAGIYQRIYVVPGETYTATVRVYLQINNPDGWDLLAFLGLDPYGVDSGDSSSTAWTEVSIYGQWQTATVTVQAVLPVMTLSLKGTRKFARDRVTTVWFDNVTFSGPVPTSPPPGPEPDPIDPESLIPATVGSNLVGNPSFEDTYTDGVSSGWNKWWVTGSGQWKRSQRVGKIGGAKYDGGGEPENVDMRPKTCLLTSGNPETDPNNNGTLGAADYYKVYDHMQDTIIIGRPMVDGNYGYYYANPTYYGARLADQCKVYEQRFPRVDAWIDWNEPGWDANWQQVLLFSSAFVQRAHELGLKACVLNLATGCPGNIWQMVNESYDPHCGEVLAMADYLGHHVYGGPNDHFMVTNQNLDDACSFGLRPRRFKDMYDRRGWRFPPVVATEGPTWVPWHGIYTPDRVLTDLTTMGEYMNADTWWCGYTNFVVGAQWSWPDFDLVGQYVTGGLSMAQAVGVWNYNNPADAMDGYHAQIFGAGEVHPKNLSELTPAGSFNGGVNRQITGLVSGQSYLLDCWMKYEFRGLQPTQLKFYLGVDDTGQTANGGATTIDWGVDQIADKVPAHEIFTHVWRTFTATGSTASIWLRSAQTVANPSFKVYVDQVEVKQLDTGSPTPVIGRSPTNLSPSCTQGSNATSQTFTVQNTGTGTLSYSISDDATWLAVTPSSGTSTGEADTITVNYATSGLSAGTYYATITISDPNAGNNPQTVGVTLTVNQPPSSDPVSNGGFEGSVQGNGVGEDWTPFATSGYGATYAVVTDVVHGGSKSQLVTNPQPSGTDRYAGVYQLVDTTASVGYTIAAWNRTSLPGGGQYDLIGRLGVDLTGGTNFTSANVTWYEFNSIKNTWVSLSQHITASGSQTTIFLEAWRKWPASGTGYAWFDDVTMTPDGPPPPPAITRSPATLSPSCQQGSNASSQTFTVQNTGGGTLSYSVGVSQAWLSVTPTSGTSTGESDTITVNYATSALSAGTYNGTITISDPNASNNPQTIAVTLTVSSKAIVAEDFESMPSWSSSYDASWGGAATWSIVAGGQSGNALQASRGNLGSSVKAKVYTITASSNYTLTVYIKCPSSSSSYWAECAYRLGNYSAQDFDQNSGNWTMIQKFSNSGTNGNGNVWTQYSASFSSGSNTQISVGYKLGVSSGTAPTIQWDTLRIQ